jgi:hypothetical protein
MCVQVRCAGQSPAAGCPTQIVVGQAFSLRAGFHRRRMGPPQTFFRSLSLLHVRSLTKTARGALEILDRFKGDL